MALNFTPLKAYITEQGRNVESRRMAGQALGNIAKDVGEFIADRKYERRSREFFDSLGDGDIRAIDAQVAEIDARIDELKKELNGIQE